MFLTERQKEVLKAQTSIARNGAIPYQRLGVSPSTVHSINSEIFQNFLEGLQVIADQDNFDTFKGRMKKHRADIWDLTRQIRGQIKDL